MALVRLGKMTLRWCDHCNVPILEQKKCAVCGGDTRQMEITPPGDVRPAFKHDIDVIRKTIDNQFGEGCGQLVIQDNHIILLNKAPALDRMDEVIMDGEVIGTMRYDLGKGWTFLSRMPAARCIVKNASKGMVTTDDGAVKPILGGSNLLAPGVISTSEGLKAGDEVIIICKDGKALASGTARMSGEDIIPGSRGMAVKIRWCEEPKDADEFPETTWDLIIKANSKEMEMKIAASEKFMKTVIEEKQKPAIISFSGGKDSLAVLILSKKAGLDIPLFFIDTGLEFPETVEYVKRTAVEHNTELILEYAPLEAFQEGLNVFGPPGRDYRWCCKTNKLGPTVRAIMKHFPDGVLSFIGQRRYESESRASKPKVWENPWTPGQIGASPIQNWTALHVWMLILGEHEEYNPWYEKGLDRIGCYLCPASDLAELEIVQESPKYQEWSLYLEEYAEKRGLPESWITYGAWRWRRMPQSIREELDKIGVSIKSDKSVKIDIPQNLNLTLQEGVSPCTLGYSIEGAFNKPLNLQRTSSLMNIIGDVELNEEEGWCAVSNVTIFEEGALIAKDKEEKLLREKVEKIRKVVIKAAECVGCGVCIGKCTQGALRLDDGKIFIGEGCIHCGKCLEPCPALTFGESTYEF